LRPQGDYRRSFAFLFIAVAMFSCVAQIPLNAERLPNFGFGHFLTNSLLVAAIVLALILWLARRATANMELVPSRGDQNIFESVIEALYDMVEGIVGRHMVARTFPLLATLFIFILAANWFGLLPGVGTVGFSPGDRGALLSLRGVESPLLRPANADLNLTLAMSLIFMIFWVVWSFQELGAGGIITHIFGVKGGVTGLLKWALLPIFIFVGAIEVISIAFRPVSLSLRLFGNIYAGENLMRTMSGLGDSMQMASPVAFLMRVLIPIPFYFLELLVGIVQALVFTLLCAVYIQLMTSHDAGDHQEHAALDKTGDLTHLSGELPDAPLAH
jgi:F-type H+-transporting ATPase subunit a